MQKKLIALAVAAAAGSAFAQTNVTLYGIADVYYAKATAKNVDGNEKFSGINSGGLSTSRLGFRGTEDLGNGLKALFTLEYGLAMDSDASIGGARQSFVGLSGGFGTVVAGRLQTPWLDHEVKYSPLPGSALLDPLYAAKAGSWGLFTSANYAALGYPSEVDAKNDGLSTNPVALGTDRVNNAVAFVSPNFSGLTMKVAHSFAGEVKGNATDDKKVSASVLAADYENGPVAVGAVYRIVSDESNNAGTTNAGNKQWSLGGSYNLGVAKLFAMYQGGKFDSYLGEKDVKIKSYSLGVSVPVSAAGSVVLAMADTKDKNIADATFGAKAYTLAYTHNLSKRTTAYAGYTVTDAKRDNPVYNAALGVAASTSDDKKVSTLAFGLRHTF